MKTKFSALIASKYKELSVESQDGRVGVSAAHLVDSGDARDAELLGQSK